MPATIAFIGAGSVVFTRELLGDLLSFPELADVAASCCTTSTRSGWRPPRRSPGDRRPARRHAEIVATSTDRRRRWTAPTSSSTSIQVGMARGDRPRLRGPGAVRAAPDDRRHARRRRHLPRRCAPSRCSTGIAGDMRGGLPGRLAAQLHQPDGDERAVPARAWPRGSRCSGCATRCYWTVHDLCELVGVPLDEVSYCVGRRQPPGAGCCAGSATARASTRCWTSGSRPTPSCAGGCASTCTAGSGYYPTETSEHSSEYVPWYLHARRGGRAAAHPGRATTSASAPRTSREYAARRATSSPARGRSRCDRRPPSTRRRSIHPS